MTVCGIFVHVKIEQADLDKLPVEEFSAKTRDRYFRWAPEPSRDPAVSVYYEAGWDRREVLVAVGNTKITCDKCRR